MTLVLALLRVLELLGYLGIVVGFAWYVVRSS